MSFLIFASQQKATPNTFSGRKICALALQVCMLIGAKSQDLQKGNFTKGQSAGHDMELTRWDSVLSLLV